VSCSGSVPFCGVGLTCGVVVGRLPTREGEAGREGEGGEDAVMVDDGLDEERRRVEELLGRL